MTGGPRRTCIGCRQVRSKHELMRLVRDGDGRARFDRDGTATGRGAYVCPATDCVGKAVAMGRLSHAFRSPVRAPLDGEADILEHWQRR